MIKLKELVIIISSMVLMSVQMYGQNVGIGANTFTPDNSALLEIRGTKGLLIPRMTTAQRDSMTLSSTPAQSLLIFNTTTKCYEGYVDGQWNQLWCSCIGFSITASASPTAICNGATSVLTASGASTYSWSHSLGTGASKTVTPTSNTTYSVTGTSSTGCSNTATVSVTVNPLPNVTASASPSTINSGQSSVLTASGASTYSWSHSLGTGSSKTVSPTSTTTYSVTGTSTAGCTATASVTVTVNTFTCGTSTVSFTYNGSSVTYGTVVHNGKCWLDRNLGASRVAISSTDANAYGDLFQWGRGADGHQIRTSGTTSNNSSTDNPGHNKFITEKNSPYDWRDPQNNNLWQGVSGTNNPCPSGWRLPTEAEWNTERLSWSSQNAAGAFASPLKLPAAGRRYNGDGSVNYAGSRGFYWSSTIDGALSRSLDIYSSTAEWDSNRRAFGLSVRCIKD